VAERHELTEEERLGDRLFMGLRLTEGIDVRAIEQDHGVDVMARYGAALTPFLDSAFLRLESGRLALTRQGMLVANEVMETFI
jgi:oxygen-independent coproporphyrinogen-3 oxidase